MRAAASMTIAALALGGCAIGPDYQKPEVEVPGRFTAERDAELEATEPRSERWWQNFHDPALDELVARADMQNIDLRRSLLALEAFRAQYTIDFARLFPQMDTGLAYSWRRVDSNQIGVPNPDALRVGFSNWQWNVASATWELDVWGAVRRQIEAGVSRVQASAAQYRAAVVSVRAEVAQAYMAVRQLQAQRAAFRDLARGYGKLVDAIDKKVRYQAGSKVELAEVRARQASALADAARFDGVIAQQVAGISVLLAETPERVRAMVAEDRPVPRIQVPVRLGVPSSLLERRPDVMAAERDLQAATAEIGVAQAGYLPRFTFAGNFIIQSPEFSGLSDVSQNMTYGITPAVSWRFMDIITGAQQARVTQAQVNASDRLLQYQLAVVRAVNQVEASITSFNAARRVQGSYTDAAREIQQAYDLAFMQYRAGTIDISRLIQFLQAFVVARDGLAQSEGLLAKSTVELYRSLGGGWDMDPMPPAVDDVRRFRADPTANDFLAPDDGRGEG
jgi:NodT family efflux transporter outer membrane factor (OMF) lipoprotein